MYQPPIQTYFSILSVIIQSRQSVPQKDTSSLQQSTQSDDKPKNEPFIMRKKTNVRKVTEIAKNDPQLDRFGFLLNTRFAAP